MYGFECFGVWVFPGRWDLGDFGVLGFSVVLLRDFGCFLGRLGFWGVIRGGLG